tara:strand:- start:420 stop:1289 length:870 start_codon:yes stop_codon:yes gene_type:complete
MNMANNLNEMISQSGMSKKVVAEEKGVTPETVSRHIHSKISMTLQDVDDYARILNCKPHEIAYTSAPLPIIGAWRNCEQTGNPKCTCRFSVYPEYYKKGVLVHGNYDHHYGAVVWELSSNYRGSFFHLNGAVHLVDISAVEKRIIDRRSLMCLSYAMTKNGVMVCGIVWPQPHNDKYTLTNMMGVEDPKKRTRTDIELSWASPIMETKFHRTGDLASIIPYESPFIAKHHEKIILPQSAARKKEYGDIYDIVPDGKAGSQHQAHLDEITKDATKVIHDDATGEVIHIRD